MTASRSPVDGTALVMSGADGGGFGLSLDFSSLFSRTRRRATCVPASVASPALMTSRRPVTSSSATAFDFFFGADFFFAARYFFCGLHEFLQALLRLRDLLRDLRFWP